MLGQIKRFAKSTLDVWEAIAAIFAVYFTIINVRALWNEEARQQYSLYRRIGLTLFNLVHILAILLAAGLLFELLVSSPVATLLISITSLLSDGYDYIQESYQNYIRQKNIQALQEQCHLEHIDFQQNVLFFEEFFELQNQVAVLKTQRDELASYLTQVNTTTAKDPIRTHVLADITTFLLARYRSLVNENEIIKNFYHVYGKNADPQEVIKTTNQEIQLIDQQKEEFINELKRLKDQRTKDAVQIESYEDLITQLNNNIKNLAVINQHFYVVNKSRTTIVQFQDQLKNLNQKYNLPPFDDYTPAQRAQLIQIEKEYIAERVQSLEKHIAGIQNPTPIKFHVHKNITNKNQSFDEETLKRILKEQIDNIDNMVKILEKDVAAKNQYLRIISGNPKNEIPQDLSKIFDSAKKLIAIKHELALAKLEEKHKLWSTRYSVVMALIAIILCCSNIWIASAIIENVMRFIGVLAGLTCLMGYFENKRVKITLQSQEKNEINKILDECRNRADMVQDPEIRSACFKELGSIAKKLHEQYLATQQPEQQGGKTYTVNPNLSKNRATITSSAPKPNAQSSPRP